jgi:hypothetical protein
MTRYVSFAHKDTGIFDGVHLTVSDDAVVSLNTPADHLAIEGHHDPLSKRVDVAALPRWEALRAEIALMQPQDRAQRRAELDALWAKVLIDHQPPAPDADHVWDDTAKRWQLSPDIAAKQGARAAALATIGQLEAKGIRAMREAALGIAGAQDRLTALDVAIVAQRASL